jgi:hypothetical protein
MRRAPPSISTHEFYATIEAGLATAPSLKRLAPLGYPRRGRARVDKDKALSYEHERTERYLHNFNLPLALHLAGSQITSPSLKAFAAQVLEDLDTFARRFSELPGGKQVLKPLWTALWDANDPILWSILAHCIITIEAAKHGATIIGFEAPTGHRQASADIALRWQTSEVLVEIVMWHAGHGDSVNQVRELALKRAEEKAAQKFSSLVAGTRGVVAVVCHLPGNTEIAVAAPRVEDLLHGTPLSIPGIEAVVLAFRVNDQPGRATGYRLGALAAVRDV